jgi:hypothetical protein
MVSKNWKLFVARQSGLWLREIVLDRLKKKIFHAKKKMEGNNGLDPLSIPKITTSQQGQPPPPKAHLVQFGGSGE